MLDDLEVAKHVAYRGDCALLLEVLSQVDGVLYGGGGDWLLDEERCVREELENLNLEICSGTAGSLHERSSQLIDLTSI